MTMIAMPAVNAPTPERPYWHGRAARARRRARPDRRRGAGRDLRAPRAGDHDARPRRRRGAARRGKRRRADARDGGRPAVPGDRRPVAEPDRQPLMVRLRGWSPAFELPRRRESASMSARRATGPLFLCRSFPIVLVTLLHRMKGEGGGETPLARGLGRDAPLPATRPGRGHPGRCVRAARRRRSTWRPYLTAHCPPPRARPSR